MYRYAYEHEYELYHYGVKGQKWGVRKKLDRAYNDWGRNRQTTANATLRRSKGNKNEAMVRTAASGVGRAVAVSLGSRAAAIGLGVIGGRTLANVAVGAGQAAAAAMLINSGVEMYKISKAETKNKK